MSELSFRELLAVLEEDRPLVELLIEEGLFPGPVERSYSSGEAEEVRVARVLLRELDVNLAGVEVVLHLRRQVFAMRDQMSEVLRLLRRG